MIRRHHVRLQSISLCVAFVSALGCGEVTLTDDGRMPLACIDADLGESLGPEVFVGNTFGEQDDIQTFCGGDSAPDMAFLWTAPSSGLFSINTCGSAFDTVLELRTPECPGMMLACNDDIESLACGAFESEVRFEARENQQFIVVVDGLFFSEAGDFRINVRKL